MTLGGAKGRGSRRMFWELAQGNVIGKPVNTHCPKVTNVWKQRKYKMEQALRRALDSSVHSPRAMQLRECTLKEFGEIFVDDRPFGTDSSNKEVNVQSKAVFSYGEDEESWVGSKFAACTWIYPKEALAGGQILSMALDFKIEAPCVVQRSVLWFSAPTNLNRIMGTQLKIKKYHEVVNSAIMDAIVKPLSRERTPKSCMLTSVARVLQRTYKKWEVNKEMKGWRGRDDFTPSSSDGDDDEEQSSNE